MKTLFICNRQVMLARVVRYKAPLGVCGTCMEARGTAETELIEGSRKGTMAKLAAWTQWASAASGLLAQCAGRPGF
jgi:sulfur relay (sulfurtransferase) complex TusBCD TusD component (DsrE family)